MEKELVLSRLVEDHCWQSSKAAGLGAEVATMVYIVVVNQWIIRSMPSMLRGAAVIGVLLGPGSFLRRGCWCVLGSKLAVEAGFMG
jgi:hypothetical protein